MTPEPTIALGQCPVPPGVRSVLVFGGTFDPPHNAHIELPRAARDRLGLEWLLYLPAGRNPMKSDGPTASDRDRIDMLRAALRGVERVSICTIELERSGPSYTVDTLRVLFTLLPETRLRLLIGADQAAQFHRWREPREIITLAEPAVMLRAPLESTDALIGSMRPHWTALELAEWRRRVVDVPRIDASATALRELLRDGPDQPRLNTLLPLGVGEFIRVHRPYGDPAT